MKQVTSWLLAAVYGRVCIYLVEIIFPFFQAPGATTELSGFVLLFAGFALGLNWGQGIVGVKGVGVFLDGLFIAIGCTLSSNIRFAGLNGDTATLILGVSVGILCTYILFRDGYFREKQHLQSHLQTFYLHRK